MKKTMAKYLAATLAVLPISGFAGIIGDWESATAEGWADRASGLLIDDASLSSKYSFNPGYVSGSETAVEIDVAGWNNNNLMINMGAAGILSDFLANSQIQFTFAVPAWTNGGYGGVSMILNADGSGWNTLTDMTITGTGGAHINGGNEAQYYFWNGSPAREVTVTLDYSSYLPLIGETPGYVEFILQSNNGDGAPSTFQIDNVALIPEPATIGLIGLFGGGMILFRRRFSI